jgi:aryl-alcohol dehydrogenase-like predicted oxidoreductase
MAPRPLGKTGLRVTPVAFGAFKIGRNEGIKYPRGYDLPDDAASARLLNAVLDLGINFIDTAPAYGLSEERIGSALSSRRREFVLSTKVGEVFSAGRSTYDFSAVGMRESVETSLRRLRTDAVDLLFLHAHAADVEILEGTDALATLLELKKAGKARAIGFSGKTPAGALRALPDVDVLMVEYHVRDPSHAQVIAAAAATGVGVVVKKGLASGHLPAADAIAHVLGTPGVNSLVIGGLNVDHMRENVRLAQRVIDPR